MKKIIALIALVGLFAAAQTAEASGYGRTVYGKASVIVQEEDGSPSRRVVRLRVPNGTMTDEGGGVILIEYATPADIAAIAIDTTTLGVISDALGVSTEALRVQLLVVAGDLSTHEADTSPHSATSANVVLRLVLRDGSGDFSAGTITASLTGNADTATALAADGTDAPSGFLCLGVNVAGDCELAVIDVAAINGSTSPVQSNALFDHDALTGSSAHGAVSANTASQIVTRDGSGNFSAAIITAALSGNASTASSLAANGANCSANEFNKGVDASGVAESCATLLDADIPDTITINLAATATALAANGGNCSANQFNKGVDASGAAESCATLVDADVPNSITIDLAVTATALAANGSNCSTNQFNKGVSASGDAESCAALVDADVPDTITIDLAATATALAANGANCSAGSFPLGVDASGVAESCTDAATQSELDTHAGLSGSSAHSATSANTASQIVTRDGSGNFSAGTITAALTGNAGTATALAADPSDCGANTFATTIAASGNLTCAAVSTSFVDDNAITSSKLATDAVTTIAILNDAVTAAKVEFNYAGSSSEGGVATTATALAANGANCSANQYPLGVDASGAVESCTADANTNAQTICTGSESLRGDGSCTTPSGGANGHTIASSTSATTGSDLTTFTQRANLTFGPSFELADDSGKDSTLVISKFRTVWVSFNGTGVVAINDSDGVDSITDIATGRYQINFTEDYGNTHYICTCQAHEFGVTRACRLDATLSNATVKNVGNVTFGTSNSSFSLQDSSRVDVICTGRR